jgi:hypothetical protein
MRRRGFLELGLWGGALLGAAGAGLALWPSTVRYRPRGPLRVLDAAAFNALAHVAARVIALDDADPARVAEDVDRTLSLGTDESAADFNKLLHLVESALFGLLLDGRPRNFSRLDGAAMLGGPG